MITTVESAPNTKAQSVTIYGLSMVTADAADAEFTTPPPTTMMPSAAPKAAPCDTPSVDADARGFLSTHCMTAPEVAKIAPTRIAAVTLGSRMPIITVWDWSSPRPKIVPIISFTGICIEPTPMEKRAITRVAAAAIRKTSFLRRTNRVYFSI